MIPLVPTVALALVSLSCSAFVILRTMLSILSPSTLSRRLYPLHFQPPSSRTLPPADKSYIWLALCDLSALGVFIWETFDQWCSSSSSAHRGTASRIDTTSRLWLALTLRQTCFLIVSTLILIHVRLRKSVSFGTAHWFLWVPLVFLVTVSTTVAGVFASTTTFSGQIFRVGYITYSSTIAVLNTVMFGCFVGTLIVIKRSLESFHKAQSSNQSAEEPQTTFAMEDFAVIREGSSWIASTTSSRRDAASISPYSDSTTRTRHTSQSAAERAATLRFPWPPPGRHPYSSLPQTPSRGCRRDDAHYKDFEPFRRRAQSLRAAALSLSSGNSWITSSLGTHPTVSAWSYPASLSSHHNPARIEEIAGSAIASAPSPERSPVSVHFPTAAVPGVRALDDQAERGQLSPTSSGRAPSSPVIEISVLRILAWLAGAWVPLLFALPYIIHLNGSDLQSSESTSILLAISVTVSSPILALNLLLRHPIPIPSDIFGTPREPHPVARYPASSMRSLSDRHTWSTGTRQVTGPSAPDEKSNHHNLKRLLGVLGPAPKLSLLPSNDHMKTPRPPQPSARNEPTADAEDGSQVVLPPRRARAQTLPPQHRHSLYYYHLPRYAQPYRHAYDRTRERESLQTTSLSVSFPRDSRHDPL